MLYQQKVRLIWHYTLALLESESSRKWIGYLWWLLDPIMTVTVYFIFFKLFLKRGGEDYIQFLFIGIICWKWFSVGVQNGCASIYKESSLIKKIYVPKIIFPWIDLNLHTVKFSAIFLGTLIAYPCIGYSITLHHLYLIILFLVMYVFILGISTLLASITPFFPDMKNIVTHLLRLFFYPSGILFSLDMIPEKYHIYVLLNPIAQLIDGFRKVIMYATSPNIFSIFSCFILGCLFYWIGLSLIKKYEGYYAKIL